MLFTLDGFLSERNFYTCLLVLVALCAAFVSGKLRVYIHTKRFSTPLRGPPSTSFLFGVQAATFTGDPGSVYEGWVNQYGSIFRFPRGIIASDKVVVTDLKAVTRLLARDTWNYVQHELQKHVLEAVVGPTCRTPAYILMVVDRRGSPSRGRRKSSTVSCWYT